MATLHNILYVQSLSYLRSISHQMKRLDALERFRDGKTNYLLATDVAARGLDVLGIETVINFDMPRQLPDYIHRVGRTARAGEKGRSISFIGELDRNLMKKIVKSGRGPVRSCCY